MPSREVGGAAVPSRVQLGGIRIAPVTGDGPAVDPLDRPMSFAQQRLWFLDQLGAMGDAYRISRWMELEGDLDVDAFRRAIHGVVVRQHAFRTTFLSVDGTPVQRIHAATFDRFPVREHDLRGHADARGELERLMAEAGAEGFDLATGPLIRGRIFLLPGGRSRFLLNAHHIICDGWSMGIFDHEVGVLYGAFSRGEPDPLPPLAMQYGDYAGWQRDPSRAGSLQAQAEFWRETLSGAPELLELPTDHPRPAQQDKTGAFSSFHLSEDLSAGLKALSRRHGVTLFTTLFAAWAVVLARVTGQDDLVIGTPTANRRKREILRLVGFFVNTLAIRVDLGGAESVGELLARVKAQSVAAQRNQEIPFEQVVDAVAPARSMAYHPLIQVMFTFQNAFRDTLEMPGMRVADAGWTVAVTAMFDLTLTLQEEGERLIGSLGYATALFEPATIERYIGYLRNVLEAMAADDAQAPAALAMLPAAERTQVVEGWNATSANYPSDACVHELFEAQAARTPDAVAVSSEEGSLTYGELNAAANRLAHHLRRRGVGPDVRVGLCVERSPEMMVGLLAVLKAGGTYVPLDPAYPADRLQMMLGDSSAALLLTHRELRATFAGIDVPVVDLVADASAWASESAENPARGALTPEHLAYVIYTSGSTGRPKGVMNEHRCLVNRLTWGQRAWRLAADGAMLGQTSLSFDGHVRELFWPLTVGARIVLARPDGHRDPSYLVETIRRERITTINLVPSLLGLLLEHPEIEGCTSIARVLCGGEALPADVQRRCGERLPGAVLHNLYGPSEAATAVSMVAADAEGADVRPIVPIGRPIANTRVYVLDGRMAPVGVGTSGELFIAGTGVARGYLDRPGLTAERFVPDPFAAVPGARLYRTGDLVRWLADGSIEFLGRTDFQVKVRGYRIELGEIEAQLRGHAAVRDAVVIVREDGERGDARLVAYYVAAEGAEAVEVEAIRSHLAETLPDYMVPAAFVRLDAMPLTPNGKLDRKALPAPDADSFATREYEAPIGATEQVVAEIWAEILGVERVGRADHFFELGGHSLLAVTLIERMRRRELKADIRALFTTPTLAEFAAAVDGGRSNETVIPENLIPAGCKAITPEMLPLVAFDQAEVDRVVATVAGGAANLQDVYPLAPLQEGILFHHLLAADGDPYLLSVLFAGDTRDRVDAFLAAMQAVIDRHDILRTGIVWEGLPEPVQVVWRTARMMVEDVEIDGAAGDVGEQLLHRYDPRHYRIDIRHAPLMQAYVARDEANGRWMLLLLRHHLVSDHTTVETLLGEVQAILAGQADTLPAPLPFRTFVAQTRLGVSRGEHEGFFTELLGDVDEPTAPFGLLDARGDGTGVGEAKCELAPALATRIRERSRKLGVSAAALCHVAYAQVLARVSGREDVVFGTLLLGRMQGGEGADRVLGQFINTLPVRLRVGSADVEAGVRRMQRLLADLMRHENASLALAQRCSRVVAPTPLFSALLNYRHSSAVEEPKTDAGRQAWAGLERVSFEERTNYPMALSVDDLGDGFRLTAQVHASVGADRVCAMMHTALERLVDALETAPATPLARMEVLPAAERRLVVEEWNATDRDFPRETAIHHLFETQAAATADAVAIAHGTSTETYAELNARANRIAHHLVARGVEMGERVVIMLPRSIDLVAAELAVLKAGAVYVPIDPTFPAERIAFMVEDSGARLVLTVTGQEITALDGVERINVDQVVDGSTENLRPMTGGDTAAYVMYTSGSTGMPKGVVIAHRGIARLVINNGYADFGATDRVAFAANPAFDATTMEVWGPLLTGGRTVVIDQDVLLDPDAFAKVLDEQGITVLFITTAVFNQYAATIPGALSKLRYLLNGGERADPASFARVLAEGGPVSVVHCYGPTETTTYAITLPVTSVAEGAQSIPLGGPISNTRIYILDSHGQPVPVGVSGEIHIGGAGVALGYLNRPELTEEKFVADPFSADADARMYRTGDLGRWLADGTIEFMGRNDFQVKVRGFRIELGEIEARLLEHADLRETIVLAREDVAGDKRLVGYYVADAAVETEALRAHLSETLPDYMVPAAFVRLPAMPLNPNGKVDRKALPAPESDAFATRGYEAPIGAMETALAAVWADVLRVERVGRHDHFFELGGHSLLAVQVISRVRQAVGVSAALGDLFARPVLADFAAGLESAAGDELPVITPAIGAEREALSFAQRRMWFLERLGGGGKAYHIAAGLRLTGELDRGALAAALERIVARHESLRATFHEVDGEPVQRTLPVEAAAFPLAAHDLAGHEDAGAELRRLMDEESAAAFDLTTGPLIRGRLVRMGEGEHVLLVTMHHIVSDGWSIGVLVQELGALYAAFRSGAADPLPALQIQYADYAAWQRRWVSGDALRRQRDFWKDALAGVPAVLELPADRARPAQQTFAGGFTALELDEELTAGLKALGEKHGATLFMTLMAGWATVLGRLAGQDDVVIGTPTANRGRAEIEGLVGFFVNTLALRVDLSGAPTVAELLGRVKDRALAAQHNQDMPFEQVVELVQPTRSMAHAPLFQVMLSWQNAPREALSLPGLTVAPLDRSAVAAAKFDLSLDLAESAGRIVGGVTFATALFDAATVERYLGYLRAALVAMAADDRQAVHALPILPAAERAQVIESFNATAAAYPTDACIHEMFEAQVERTPEAPALTFDGETLSYTELNARANRLAHHLRTLGVGPDVRVAVCVERSVEMVVTLYGILKAGGAYLPLDPAYPEDRLRYMLADGAPAAVLTQASLAGLFDGCDVPVIDLTSSAAWDAQPATNPARIGTPANLAYVIYTSGSTGMPKGVMNAHRGVINRLVWMQDAFGLTADDSVLQKTPFSFDVSVWEFFWPLMVGARLVIAKPEGHKDPSYLVETIRRENISTLHFVPSMLQLFLEHADVESCTSLSRVMCSGEALPAAAARRFRERLPMVALHNLYGPTEAAVDVTAWRCPADAPSVIPIGSPIANTRIYLLDNAGQPVPVGVSGELYIAGVQVARGYLNRPSLTAERFVVDPFSADAGARMYRTGDLARWLADGTIEYLGRTDFQVKVRGFRIELGEIESRLLEHEEIREAVVLAREDAAGDKRLVGYYVSGEPIEVEELRAHLSAHLPEYMVPAAFVHLNAMPLNANGKADRKALPAPEGTAFGARVYEAPVGDVETVVAAVWSDVLRIETIGRADHFFELGGHSLLAVKVVSRIRQALGVDAELGDVFQRPVLADFARALATAPVSELPAVLPAADEERAALSFSQQRLWFLEQLGSAGAAFHVPAGLRLRGALNQAALVRSLDGIVARHEALRTTFHAVDGQPVQVIAPAEESHFALVAHDLAGRADAEAELARIAANEAAAPFDLAAGPLIRGRLVRIGIDEHVLLVTMHHIVSDGWSTGVLTRELSTLYGAFVRGEVSPLAPLPVQYADYAAWQRRRVSGEVLSRQAGYWKQALAGAPELLELPADRARPARQDHAGAFAALELDAELTAALKGLAQREGATLFMTLLAGWAAVLGRLAGQDDVVVGTPTANRARPEVEGLIGFFVNTLALRVDLSDSPTGAELLARVKAAALDGQRHQDIPFEQVVEAVQPVRSMAHSPLFQVMFAWQNTPQAGLELPGLTLAPLGCAAHVTAQLDLTLTLREVDGRIVGGVEYATALFDAATVERYLGYMVRVLTAMAADSALPVASAPLLADGERSRVLHEWNATEAQTPSVACAHEMFEAQVERTPHALAIVQQGTSLTYAELNARANRLARHLRSMGVRPDARVAICLERSPEMVVAVLAVMKAGGAYVPLDPAYPTDRLRWMLADAAPVALVTRASLAARFDGIAIPAVTVDDDAAWAGLGDGNPSADEVGLRSDHLAYVIYTSGSTGQPKGVMVEHRSLCSLLDWLQARMPLAAGEASLQRMSFSFDASVQELMWPLVAGARVVMASAEGYNDPDYLVETLRRERVAMFHVVPSLLQVMLEHPGIESCTGLTRVLCGGEAVTPALVRRFAERLPAAELVQMYGPTETTVTATARPCPAGEAGVRVPLGGPVPNTRIYLLDAFGQPVPVGVAGEMWIGGAQVARGYLNRPELTAERFVRDPFSADVDARMYGTGDMARWLADGSIEFLGRADDQVKVRGFRIELGEIEARLAEHASVRDAAVLVREDVPGDRRLVAYHVGQADAETLRAHLAAHLPDHMVPAAYVAMDAFPLTPNGKVDRRALPAPDADAFATRAYEAPATATERAVAEIWADVLRVDRVGRSDGFFALGGHSLLAVQVVSRVRRALAVEVALGELFVRPVLADFARHLDTAPRAELPAIVPAADEERQALSFAQQRLWFLEELGAGGRAYHMPSALRLTGALDVDALGRALDRIVARHEALRTTFHAVDGHPVQQIASDARFPLAHHDLAGQEDAETELRLLAADEAGSPFDLAAGPLVRGRLVRMGEDDHVLLVTMHHIVSDGWSMGVLVDELAALYAAFVRGHGDPLPALPVQYADYAAWQRKWVSGDVLQRQADHWKHALAGVPERLELPADRVRPARQDVAGAFAALELDEALTAGLKALGDRHGATLFMTLMAGWATVLGRLAGQDDVVIGTPTANRGRPEVEALVGFFVNTLALRVDLSDSPSVADLLARVKAAALAAQHNQDIPFEQVVELVQPERSLAHSPLFQVMFAWQNTPRGDLRLPGLTLAPLAAAQQVTARFDLTLNLYEAEGRIAGGVEYATALFDGATVERWLGYLRQALTQMVADDSASTSRIELMPTDERTRIVHEWNATAAEFPRETAIHHLFETQAARTPDAVAVAHGTSTVTYAELNARANRIAHHLAALGVEAGERVVIMLPRSIDLIAAELATLKAGAVYVPIDPTFPAERIAFMAADSGARFVLSAAGKEIPALDGVERIDVDSIVLGSTENLPATTGGDTAAYVMYTSGSTGTPKGAVIAHRGIARLAINNGYTDFQPSDRVAFAANPAFDATTMEVWGPLLNGGRTVVVDQDVLLDPDAFAAVLEGQGITVLFITTAVFNQYAATIPGALSRLRCLLNGGERADPASFARVLAEGGPVSVIHCYGPTETTTYAITLPVTSVAEGTQSIPLGGPISNTTIYILDSHGQPVPVGVSGEIHIGGAGVALGYLNRPELTAEKFVADPFSAEKGARMYRTGDLARWLADGTLEFMGRTDFQVKVRGFRIELGEIEARLLEHADLRETIVLAREDVPGDKRLVAYYVSDDAVEVDVLRAHLAETLPDYMVPAAFVHLAAMPLNPNGKVDRRALPAPDAGAFATRGYEAPVGATEEALAAIWADVLRVGQVGRWDHFFEMGGHSLLAVQIISRVRKALGAEVALGDLFLRPVLADFAAGLHAAERAELPPIEPIARTGDVPLSFAQQRLWFLEELGSGGRAYHIPTRLRLRGELDRAALAEALDRIVERHEALRTTFHEADGQPVQRVAPAEEACMALAEHDLTGGGDAEDALRRIMAEESVAAFDLATGPLIRATLVRMAADDHVLLVTMHHIVSDGWSMGILVEELGALYAAFVRGDEDPLAPLTVQYADYAAWQRRWVSGDVLQRQADHWRRTLAGAPDLLELPTDRARAPQQDHAGAFAALTVDAELTASLKALSARHGTTLFMTLMAGWAAVLSRLSGQDDVVIGTPTANRGRHEIEGLVGFFVNTLAMRVDLAGTPTVAGLLGRVKAQALAAQHNQDIPFEQVVEAVQPARSLAHSPLFQVLFAWQNTPRETLELPGLTLSALERSAHATAKFDLSLALEEADGRISGGLTYATALFDAATVERWLGYLRGVLAAMAADESLTVDALPMMPASERVRVVEEWNRTAAEYPVDACLHELIEAQVERTPDAVAVVFHHRETLTYRELDARANRLAHHLRALGVGSDTLVAVCLERSLEMMVGLLAVLKAGGAYVPLDPEYPDDRLRYMLEDSAPAVLLTHGELGAIFAGIDVPTLDLGDDAAWAHLPATKPERGDLMAQHLCYVIYTSGSTGRPKGVMNQHRAVVNRLLAGQRAWELGAGEAVLAKTSLSFDGSLRELFWPLVAGARVVLARPGGHRDVDYLVEIIREEQVTTVNLVPSLLHVLLEHPDATLCTALTRVLCGGEALPVGLLKRFRERMPHTVLHNLYGPSEAATALTAYGCVPQEGRSTVPIGRPSANVRAYVLDARGEPVPVGVAGELCIGGHGVARGYLARPELTAEKFVADPFCGEADARMYRTGDMARWLADGTIEFLGRNDFQVKLRGFRIEPGEIEAVLAEHEGVREAAVLVREDVPGDRRLVAYLVTSADVQVEALRAHAAERLPEYMVPAAYVAMDAFPLTPNGKLDRKALPAPDGGAYAVRAFEAPDGVTEEAVAEIWADVLRLEGIGRHDHFFELGGHSLLAVQVISRVRQVLEVQVAVRELFVHPVLADFARHLETAAGAELPPIERAERDGAIPLSFAQQRLWFLEQLGGAGGAYHIPKVLRLKGDLDLDALTRALDRIVQRHESLRTTFQVIDGEPVQCIAPAQESRFHLEEDDLASWRGEDGIDAELRRMVVAETGAPFDLERGPLVRGRLVRVAADDHVLVLTMHHAVSDGWSTGVLVRELTALYAAFRLREADPLPALPVQYADYAVWQRRSVGGEVLREQAEFWTQALAGAPEVLELPTDRARPAQPDPTGAYAGLELDAELTAGLKALGRRHGTTLFMTLLAGWATVLGRLAGQRDVVIGTPTANRGRHEIEGLVGFFVNTLALRVDLSGSPQVGEVLARARAAVVAAQHHQDIPFEQVVELVQPGRSMAHGPLFQVLFAWQNTPRETLELPGLTLGSLDAEPTFTAKLDLALTLEEVDGRILGGMVYPTALFDAGTVDRHLSYLRTVLQAMVADERRAVECLPMLPAAERHDVVEGWNATAADFPAHLTVHEMFEAQARRTPHAPAVVQEGVTLTYAELNAHANRLAHHLRSLGVGPDTRVAVCMERSPQMLVGLMAVLKAGGAYVPMDPAYPLERLRYMLEDAAPAVVLSHGDLARRSAAAGVPVLDLSADECPWDALPETNLSSEGAAGPGDVAYVIYTSGSTGRPKGVLVEHRGVVNMLTWAQEMWSLGAHEAVMQRISFSFDVSVRELFWPLTAGARVVMPARDGQNDPDHLVDLLAEQGVGTIHLVPSLLQVLLEHPRLDECTRLTRVMCGGEVLRPALLKRFRERLPNATLHHMYGPTESTVAVTARGCTAGDEARERIPLGRPMANTRIYLLDEAGQPVPVGAKGELHVAGVQVARGYLNRPDLTAEKFVADPFSGDAEARMYRTGDLARWLPDGTLEFLGRDDGQVKVRGYRIELAEIEARLAAHPEVREAVVMAREDVPGDTRLAAYFAGAPDLHAEELRAYLAAALPEYMVPAAYVKVDAFPLTPNGKVDRAVLPAPDAESIVARAYEEPQGDTEVVLAEIWSALLNVERVGRHDHFFELGGHSLLATKLVLRIKQELEVEVALRDVFEMPVLSGLAEHLLDLQLAQFDAEDLARLMLDPPLG
jgi:amino acid adenylation domain-containing protein